MIMCEAAAILMAIVLVFAAPLTNLVYDIAGTYVPGLFAMSAVPLVVAVFLQFALNTAKRRRDLAIEENAK